MKVLAAVIGPKSLELIAYIQAGAERSTEHGGL